jgi:hypothetical protein
MSPVQLVKLRFVSGAFNVVAGVVIHELDTILVQLLARVSHKAVQLTEVVGEVKTDMEPVIDHHIDLCLGKGRRPPLDLIPDALLRPL